ncbi:hypothetical protein RHABOEDO_000912 [Candidatus Rhabdochlamydia oedothoracis]|uniref:Uncharacterized protein n=1 Tax=Candidatus Rhabdochlamydia oedothoracis TaxID=2720720 RepID=A0ABX8V0G1_9BACT|nr:MULTISPECIES: hypothetical protein [Rhabdochlamydia]KAG6559861.1 hypothetical protein RHOW815_000132 [Candidatus Rhabdochlamydia sp. W815]QYF48708.1 hypothetical protein RHABOEDO_000912 [Candidatus Rhabdochlamydia oedothoracis]
MAEVISNLQLDPERALMSLITKSENQVQERIKKKSTEVDQLHAVLNIAINLNSIFSEKPEKNKVDFSNNKEIRDQLNQLFIYNPEWIADFHQNKFNESELQNIRDHFKEVSQLQQLLANSSQDKYELENRKKSLDEKLNNVDPQVYSFDATQFSKIKYMLIYIEKSTSTKLSQTVSESHQMTEEVTLLLKTCNETERRRDQFMKHILGKV